MRLTSPARDRAPLRCALTGARGGYGRSLLAQLASTPELLPSVLVDPDVEGVAAMLAELADGTRDDPSAAARPGAEPALDAAAASAILVSGGTVLAAGPDAVPWDDLDILVEASGKIGPGCAYARQALRHGVHVVMVSKEVDTVAGPALAGLAAEAGLSYLPADGDQPANLLRLADWVAAVGLDVVAMGKSAEHDLLLDPAAGTLTQDGVSIPAPGFTDLLTLGADAPATLASRAALAAGLKRSAAADPCEMTVVAQRLGIGADVEQMHYPIARIDELADVYARREHGGLIGSEAALDVFSALRLPGEASFAGGVFAIVRTGDPATWELLREKGHVISRDGRYACLYWPYHLMGVETPLTLHAAADGRPGRAVRASTILAARAARDLDAGTEFHVAGHHHEIDGVDPVMIAPVPEATAFYLLDGARLRRPVRAGELIGAQDLEGLDPLAHELHRAGREDAGTAG
ncbi:homoserine dehydrogenase [Brachybacterium hainanense]|uniref:Homoserine dehydrogenase n=1 Tax=Brachybacterium hainanense TaxID=1541174 RepID=A0ABV6RA37_9MICO